MVHEIKLQNTPDSILQTLLSEIWSAVVLDSGASTTVCGKPWFEQYTKSLLPKKNKPRYPILKVQHLAYWRQKTAQILRIHHNTAHDRLAQNQYQK